MLWGLSSPRLLLRISGEFLPELITQLLPRAFQQSQTNRVTGTLTAGTVLTNLPNPPGTVLYATPHEAIQFSSPTPRELSLTVTAPWMEPGVGIYVLEKNYFEQLKQIPPAFILFNKS